VDAAHRAPDQVGNVGVGVPIISIKGLHKWYSGVHALNGIDLEIEPGELIGLVGDNGAGKSTLIKVLSGVELPDSGEIRVEGRLVQIASPKSAMNLGIETVYQYNSMVPTMSVARNLFIGREPLGLSFAGIGILNQRKMREDSTRAIADVDLHLRSPDTLVGELSGGQRQGVAIARAMYFKSKVLILDEPTNHLSVKETAKVLGFVKGLSAQNVTGILISHNLHHVFSSCERVVAMARGKIVLDKEIAETSIDEITELM
jgi:simple sugar transport system ATP-binding protein